MGQFQIGDKEDRNLVGQLTIGDTGSFLRRRLQQAGRAAGLPGWRDITGHSGRVGMAQDLSAAGFALPELMTAGRWKSPRMPARYTERQAAGQVRWLGTTRAVGGRGPASQPREAGASEVVAVSGSSTR